MTRTADSLQSVYGTVYGSPREHPNRRSIAVPTNLSPVGLTDNETDLRQRLRDTAHDLALTDPERLALADLLDEVGRYRRRDPFLTLRRFAGELNAARDRIASSVPLNDQDDEPPLVLARGVLELELAELILDDDVDLRDSATAAAADGLAAALGRIDDVIRRGDTVALDAHETELDARRTAETRTATLEAAIDRALTALNFIPGGYFEGERVKPLLGALEDLDQARRA